MDSENLVPTFADHVRRRADDDNPAILFEDRRWTYRQWCADVATRAAMWLEELSRRPVDAPRHIGVLLENTPEFTMWLGVAAVTGSTLVGINPTRRGAELSRDIAHTDCHIVVTDSSQLGLLDNLDLGSTRVIVSDDVAYEQELSRFRGRHLPTADDCHVSPADQFLLLFTSGTSGAPKAVITSHQRLNFVATSMCGLVELKPDDVAYIAMPLFHSNALFTAWAPSLVTGSVIALRRKFSASEFLADVRRFNATYFNYVGKPLAYVLATPEQPDDANNPLRRGYGNEGSEVDIEAFSRRFGCQLHDGYGQTETGASIIRIPGMPAGSLGVAAQPTITILDPNTQNECPRAQFDEQGRLVNAEEAIGEIVNMGGGTFEGYWRNDEANQERLRGGAYWTGDLGYRDSDGFFFFAGRSADWLRVDGENFAGAPIERIVMRYPNVILAAVYGVPDPEIGDRVMVSLQVAPDATFSIQDFSDFLDAQSDLGPKWRPTFVQIVDAMPMTQTNKILKRDLVKRRWHDVETDPHARLWWRQGRTTVYEPFTSQDANDLRTAFQRNKRENVLL